MSDDIPILNEDQKESVNMITLSKDDQVILKDDQVILKNNTNNNLPAIGQIKEPPVSSLSEEMKLLKEEAHLKFLAKKTYLLDKEKLNVKDKDKRLECPSCKYALHVKYNFSEKGWRCYSCGAIDFEPKPRDANYFDEVLSKKTIEENKFVAIDGKVVRQVVPKFQIIRRKTRRAFADSDLMTREQVLTILKGKYDNAYLLNDRDIRNAALMATLFLTGARIQEICGMPVREIKTLPNGEKKSGKKIKGKYIIEPLRRKQIIREVISVDNKPIEVISFNNLPVLKRRISDTIDKETYQTVRGIIQRNISIPFEIEQEFFFYIEKYLRKVDEKGANPETVLFEMTKTNAFKISWRYFNKKYNHWWRHIRASDLSSLYQFNGLQLKHFFGWASERQAAKYSHLSSVDLLKSMVRGK